MAEPKVKTPHHILLFTTTATVFDGCVIGVIRMRTALPVASSLFGIKFQQYFKWQYEKIEETQND